MRDQPRIATHRMGIEMVYVRGVYEPGTSAKPMSPEFSDGGDVETYTSLPVAVSSWVLESIGFTELVNGMVTWDPKQCDITPGDAAKAMVLALSMGAERPAIENLAKRFEDEPL